MEFFLRKILVLLFAFTALSAVPFTDVEAQTVDLTISSGTDFINHYPGPDGLIGNNDDVISDQLTAIQKFIPPLWLSYGALGLAEQTPTSASDPRTRSVGNPPGAAPSSESRYADQRSHDLPRGIAT